MRWTIPLNDFFKRCLFPTSVFLKYECANVSNKSATEASQRIGLLLTIAFPLIKSTFNHLWPLFPRVELQAVLPPPPPPPLCSSCRHELSVLGCPITVQSIRTLQKLWSLRHARNALQSRATFSNTPLLMNRVQGESFQRTSRRKHSHCRSYGLYSSIRVLYDKPLIYGL